MADFNIVLLFRFFVAAEPAGNASRVRRYRNLDGAIEKIPGNPDVAGSTAEWTRYSPPSANCHGRRTERVVFHFLESALVTFVADFRFDSGFIEGDEKIVLGRKAGRAVVRRVRNS